MTFVFNIPLPVQPKSTNGGALAALFDEGEEALERRGLTLASRQFLDDYLFTRMGGWNVALRSSVIRVRAARALP